MNVLFHNKRMDKIDMPRILNSKRVNSAVVKAVLKYLSGPFLVLSYTYTKR